MPRHLFPMFSAIAVTELLLAASVLGVQPAETLLPPDTRVFVSFPDMDAVRTHFEKTELGQLARDPAMKPFADDLVQQLRERFGASGTELGITWDDLAGIYAGEACLARIYSNTETQNRHATVLLVDVTNHAVELGKVLALIARKMTEREATELPKRSIGNVELTTYQLKKKLGELEPAKVILFVVDDQFVVANHEQVAESIVARASGKGGDGALASNPVFLQTTQEVEGASQKLVPHMRWYLDPFGYAELLKATNANGTKSRGGILDTLRNQGFDVVKGAAGHINLATEDHEVLHRTFVLAPAAEMKKAARMLQFPATDLMPAPEWVPRELATYLAWNWDLRKAFDHSISLIDEIADAEGFVEDVLGSFATDPKGPQIDIRKELLDHLDQRILLFSSYELPMSTTSERLLAAVRVRDEAQVAAALKKLWRTDPTARERNVRDHVVWEIVPDNVEIPRLEVQGAVPLPGGAPLPTAADDGSQPIQIPNTAMTVAHGYLLVTTHIDFLDEILAERASFDSLNESADFQAINRMLTDLGAGEDCFRFFSRTDEEYRSAYEMIRSGKMPESKSVLGRLLNRLLGPEEKGVVRKQRLDGKSLPDFQVVRRHLGPAGMFVQPRQNGWFFTGVMASKQRLVEHQSDRAAVSTASNR